MAKQTHLVIVESPTKGRTIEQFLGPDFRVVATYGHVRDLPKSELGVDEETLEPRYVIPPKARKTIKILKEMMRHTSDVYIATDLDREGEAIGWHIMQAVDLPQSATGNRQSIKPKESVKLKRITFHEITKSAIEEALKHPRSLNISLVDAQQARRVLDRLVGYKLSPLLWKKIARGLSAGRVQSVALRLIVDREREINKFTPQEYWSVEAELEKDSTRFTASLIAKDGKKLDKFSIRSADEAQQILTALTDATYTVADTAQKIVQRHPSPPFTTSTLQQEAARQLGWSASQTMRIAQSLYEQGLITYHRTDSVHLSWSAIDGARNFIAESFGKTYLPDKPRQFRTKSRGAQEAHEAIRPAYPNRTADQANLTDPRERGLYDLIWRRMIASQMSPAVFEEKSADITANNYLFRATGSSLKFDGFLTIWLQNVETKHLPDLTKGNVVTFISLAKSQHFTEPPARYNMASLIKTLEEHGIGRPSTYAPIISTIIERNYVTTNRGVFTPTDLGTTVTELLVQHFPEIVDISFTAHMEEDLDAIALGKTAWKGIIESFYRPFAAKLVEKQSEIQKSDYEQVIDEKCPESGHPLVAKIGRFGKFIACSGFPECKYTRPIVIDTGLTCPECTQGQVIERKTRRGKVFWGCSRYPDCKWATWKDPRKVTPVAPAQTHQNPSK